ncbi:MAG: hypothetical protein HOO87_03070 [Methyloglobulus sp.]|nr:hypothetical protein [Methyloglobulus sp.]
MPRHGKLPLGLACAPARFQYPKGINGGEPKLLGICLEGTRASGGYLPLAVDPWRQGDSNAAAKKDDAQRPRVRVQEPLDQRVGQTAECQYCRRGRGQQECQDCLGKFRGL